MRELWWGLEKHAELEAGRLPVLRETHCKLWSRGRSLAREGEHIRLLEGKGGGAKEAIV